MLNSKAVSDLLTDNSDARLCKYWYLMTPNGTLLAYSHTIGIRDLRREAAKAALLWQEHHQDDADSAQSPSHDPRLHSPTASVSSLLHTLTVESDAGNTIIRSIQPQLLLVLEGGVPPRRRTFEPRVTPEGPGDAPYLAPRTQPANRMIASSVSSAADSTASTISHSVLEVQRRKLDAMAAAIRQTFEQSGFKMPDQGNTKLF